MTYDVVFDSEAVAFLEKMEKAIARRIWNKIVSAKDNLYHYFSRLSGRSDYKLRVGDYRVIAEIDNNSRKINITLIGHRKNVYAD